jgi:hypothetical protein
MLHIPIIPIIPPPRDFGGGARDEDLDRDIDLDPMLKRLATLLVRLLVPVVLAIVLPRVLPDSSSSNRRLRIASLRSASAASMSMGDDILSRFIMKIKL